MWHLKRFLFLFVRTSLTLGFVALLVIGLASIPVQLFLIGFLLAMFAAGACAVFVLGGGRLNASFAQVARDLDGTFQQGRSWIGNPKVQWTRAGQTFTLDLFADVGQPLRPRLIGPWHDRVFTCEIRPRSDGRTTPERASRKSTSYGSERFAGAYEVLTSEPAEAQAFLTPHVQRRLMILRLVPSECDGACVRIEYGRISVSRSVPLADPVAMRQFAKLALELVQAEAAQEAAEIRVLKIPAESRLAPNCPICGEPITDDVVACADCQTAHHRECWKYFGRCAVYACDQTGFRPVKL